MVDRLDEAISLLNDALVQLKEAKKDKAREEEYVKRAKTLVDSALIKLNIWIDSPI